MAQRCASIYVRLRIAEAANKPDQKLIKLADSPTRCVLHLGTHTSDSSSTWWISPSRRTPDSSLLPWLGDHATCTENPRMCRQEVEKHEWGGAVLWDAVALIWMQESVATCCRVLCELSNLTWSMGAEDFPHNAQLCILRSTVLSSCSTLAASTM